MAWRVRTRAGFKGAHGARAPGLPPTGGLPPCIILLLTSLAFLIFRLLQYSLPLSDPQVSWAPGPHQLSPALVRTGPMDSLARLNAKILKRLKMMNAF